MSAKMWNRFYRGRDQTIGEPVLIDTSLEESYLETIPEVESLKSRDSVIVPGLPPLPFRAVEPMSSAAVAPSEENRTSSVYSRPSSDLPQHEVPDTNRRTSSLYSAVSPLATPRASADLPTSGSPDVSPIEALPDMPRRFPTNQPKHKSQLPVLRKPAPEAATTITKFGNSPGWRRAPPEKNKGPADGTRWDDYSGEPTTSEEGKPASVKPGTKPVEYQFPDLKSQTKRILADLRERDTTNRKAIGRIPPPGQEVDSLDHPVQREPWRGASGRTTLVNPVKNTPGQQLDPIKIPQNIGKRVAPGTNQAEPSQSPSITIRTVPPESVGDEIKPVAPLRLGKNSPNYRSPTTAEFAQPLQSPFRSPNIPRPESPTIAPTPKGSEQVFAGQNGLPTPSTLTAILPSHLQPRSDSLQRSQNQNSIAPSPPSHVQPRTDSLQSLAPVDPDQEQSSRFSWTTYATTVHDSPPNTPRADQFAPPVPSIPNMPTPLAMKTRPVNDRPQTSPSTNAHPSNSNAKILVRKPTPSDRRRASTLLTTGSRLDKSLPQCPPEMEAPDKISTLEARMDEFALRKRNINKVINQLSSGVKPTAIAFDLRTREQVKKTIEGLNNELAEIIQEEHEVGLKLHRAQKKRDKEDLYENPTGLWIKRVTS